MSCGMNWNILKCLILSLSYRYCHKLSLVTGNTRFVQWILHTSDTRRHSDWYKLYRNYVNNPCCTLQTASWLPWKQASVCALCEKACSVVERGESKRSVYLNDFVCVIDKRATCVWSRIHMTHSMSHSIKLRRNIAETVNEVCYTTCCESSESRPPFVSLYLLVALDFLCLCSGSPHYTEYVWRSASEVFIAAVLFTVRRKGGGKKPHTNGSEFNLGFYESVTAADLKAPNPPRRKQTNASFWDSLGLNTSQWDTKAFLGINETQTIFMAGDTMIQVSLRRVFNSLLLRCVVRA